MGMVLTMALCQLVLVGLILRWGSLWDRWGAIIFLVVAWSGLVASQLQLSNILQIAFGLTLVLFLAMWFLAEKARRWWMIGMAGFQLMSLMSYLAPANSWERLREVFVLFHWLLSGLCMACLVLALVEIGWARRQGAQSADGPDLDPRDRP